MPYTTLRDIYDEARRICILTDRVAGTLRVIDSLTVEDERIIRRLYTEGPQSTRELADRAGQSVRQLGRSIRHLRERRYVIRRNGQVRLTPSGHVVGEIGVSRAGRMVERIAARVDMDELAAALVALRRLTAAVEAEIHDT
jgi:DNA-binding MarR family transcriptional regulator